MKGTIPDTEAGLGPRFNLDSCEGCHAFPATGGTSPVINPQVEVAKKEGASNDIPSFIRRDGPVREARFKHNPDGTPDGGVRSQDEGTRRAAFFSSRIFATQSLARTWCSVFPRRYSVPV